MITVFCCWSPLGNKRWTPRVLSNGNVSTSVKILILCKTCYNCKKCSWSVWIVSDCPHKSAKKEVVPSRPKISMCVCVYRSGWSQCSSFFIKLTSVVNEWFVLYHLSSALWFIKCYSVVFFLNILKESILWLNVLKRQKVLQWFWQLRHQNFQTFTPPTWSESIQAYKKFIFYFLVSLRILAACGCEASGSCPVQPPSAALHHPG